MSQGGGVLQGMPIRLDPINDSIACTSLPSVPSTEIHRTRFIYDGENVYVFGGRSGLAREGTKRTFKLTVASGEWKEMASMEHKRHYHALVQIDKDQIMIIGKNRMQM